MLRWERVGGSPAPHITPTRSTSVVTSSLPGHLQVHLLLVRLARFTTTLTSTPRHGTTLAVLAYVTSCEVARHVTYLACGWRATRLMAMEPRGGGA